MSLLRSNTKTCNNSSTTVCNIYTYVFGVLVNNVMSTATSMLCWGRRGSNPSILSASVWHA